MGTGEADTVAGLLGLDSGVARALREIPTRGSPDTDVPTDPTTYLIREVTLVYGTITKAPIHEEFGDGVTSAVTFNMDIEREGAG